MNIQSKKGRHPLICIKYVIGWCINIQSKKGILSTKIFKQNDKFKLIHSLSS